MEAEVYKVYHSLMEVENTDVVEETTDKNGDKWVKVSVYKYAKKEHLSLAIAMAKGVARRCVLEETAYSPKELLENEGAGRYSKSFLCKFRIEYKIRTKKDDSRHIYLQQIKKERVSD
jgi:hypothetical protein